MSKNKNYRKYAVTTIAAAAAVASVAPVVTSADTSFSDVTADSVPNHYEAIMSLVESGAIDGYEDGSFGPWVPVKRVHAAKILTEVLDLPIPEDVGGALKDLNDVDASSDHAGYIAAVKEAGIFDGDKDNNFNSYKALNRQQMAKVLVEAFDLDELDAADVNINTEKVDNQFKGYVQTLANLNITDVDAYDGFNSMKRAPFASFVQRTLGVLGESEDGDLVAENVRAINNTTVEVVFAHEIEDIKALDFEIDGLDVENAVEKQTDGKIAVLTTSPQTGGEEYAVSVNGNKAGTFEGISAVTPSDISINSNSTQAVVGEEVTVSAEVDVEEGENAEGIPVTFNIITHRGGLNSGAAHEVYTDADGVATYTYTQYYGGQDTIVAYPTGAPATRSTEGKVYWGAEQQLTITEVTDGNDLANGSKKVYKIAAKTQDGGAYKNQNINIAFEENINVPQDEGVTDVTVTDATTNQGTYPYQYTTGGESNFNPVQVRTDKNGEATFTLTGSDASVTPIAFIDGTWEATGADPDSRNQKWDSTELQAAADTVTFAAVQELEVNVESIGTSDAAAIDATIDEIGLEGTGDGGRDYKATIRDTEGKLQPKGTTVYATVTEDDLEGDVWLVDADDNEVKLTGENSVPLTVDEDGEVEFTLIGEEKSYATPTVFNDNGDEPGELDDADAQGKGEIVYFGDAVLKTSTMKVVDKDGKEVKSVKSGETAYFEYQVTDQNGKANTSPHNTHEATFQVKNTGFVNSINAINGSEVTEIDARDTESIKVQAEDGKATLEVTSPDGPSDVAVDVSSSQYTLTGGAATVGFTATGIIGTKHTGQIENIDLMDNEVTFEGKDAVSYEDADFKYDGNTIDQEEFERLIAGNEGDNKVTAVRGADGWTFEILSVGDADVEAPDTGDDENGDEDADGEFTFTTADVAGNSVAIGLGLGTFTVEGTIAEEDIGDVSEIELTFTGGEDNLATPNEDESTTTIDVNVEADGTFSYNGQLNNSFTAVNGEYEVNGVNVTTGEQTLTINDQ